ncbi:hypothetical protein QUB68_18065 [Microcoleus sp. A006_D1]|uniref:hypothetical protein n=1 Tax=Microcoleus sp. A006_D1 TaxID=3055267 RepID=UPI002FCEF9CE
MKTLLLSFDTSLNYFRRLSQEIAVVDSTGVECDRASRLPYFFAQTSIDRGFVNK